MSGNAIALLAAALTAFASSLGAVTPFTIVVTDPPGYGFNDPTPAQPVAGNNGATVGDQRLIALQHAAAIWGSYLDSPVEIRIRASFTPLDCTAKNGTLGAATAIYRFAFQNPPSEIVRGVWYQAALANKLREQRLNPEGEDVRVWFNPDVGQEGCFEGKAWYYGLDAQPPTGGFDFVPIVLHELAHGLGFGWLQSEDPELADIGSLFEQYVHDTTKNKALNEMSRPEREESIRNYRRVIWSGVNARHAARQVLTPGTPVLHLAEPAAQASSSFFVGKSSFGAPLSSSGIQGEIALVAGRPDSTGAPATDACAPLANAAELVGRIALADRGTCNFTEKARHAQAAGAIALLIADNADGILIEPSGQDPQITIPVAAVTLGDGKILKAALGGHSHPSATLLRDPKIFQGADPLGRPLIFSVSTGKTGSIGSHWDPIASPDQLMEPGIADSVGHSLGLPRDLTLALMRDLGWFADWDGVPDGIDECPDSDRGGTVRILSCETGVPNKTSPVGCRTSDFYKRCASAAQKGRDDFAACIASVSGEMMKVGLIDNRESSEIGACALRVPLP